MGRYDIEGAVQRWLVMAAAFACMALAHLIQPARQGSWLLPYIDFSGVSLVISFLWWARLVASVCAVVLAVVAMLPARALGVVADGALWVAAFVSIGAAVRLERRRFARKYRLAQKG